MDKKSKVIISFGDEINTVLFLLRLPSRIGQVPLPTVITKLNKCKKQIE